MIWGAANHGATLARTVKDDIEVLAFIDNDIKKVGTTFLGYPVVAKEEIRNFDFDKIVISLDNFDIKTWLLKSAKIDENRIFESYGSIFADKRIFALSQIADLIHNNNINGAVAELGVFRGDFAKEINKAFVDRKLYLFDTFEGFADADINYEKIQNIDSFTARDFSNTSIELVQGKMPYLGNCVFCAGYFPDTTLGLQDIQFCFASIDADLFNPIYEGIRFFYQNLSKGGFIMVHDYYNSSYPGAKLAVEKFVSETGAVRIPIQDHCGSIVIGK